MILKRIFLFYLVQKKARLQKNASFSSLKTSSTHLFVFNLTLIDKYFPIAISKRINLFLFDDQKQLFSKHSIKSLSIC